MQDQWINWVLLSDIICISLLLYPALAPRLSLVPQHPQLIALLVKDKASPPDTDKITSGVSLADTFIQSFSPSVLQYIMIMMIVSSLSLYTEGLNDWMGIKSTKMRSIRTYHHQSAMCFINDYGWFRNRTFSRLYKLKFNSKISNFDV